MTSTVASSSFHAHGTSVGPQKFRPEKAPIFSRKEATGSSLPKCTAETTGARDKGGINPNASLYDEVFSYANEMPSFKVGAQSFGGIKLGVAPSVGNTPVTNPFLLEGINGGIHAAIYAPGSPLVEIYQVEFNRGASGHPQVIFNGQTMSPMSAHADLEIAAALGKKIVSGL
jgi:hypothetical protein